MQLLVAQAHLVEEPRILDGDGRQVGIGLEEEHLLLGKALQPLAGDDQNASLFFSIQQREEGKRA